MSTSQAAKCVKSDPCPILQWSSFKPPPYYEPTPPLIYCYRYLKVQWDPKICSIFLFSILKCHFSLQPNFWPKVLITSGILGPILRFHFSLDYYKNWILNYLCLFLYSKKTKYPRIDFLSFFTNTSSLWYIILALTKSYSLLCSND